MFDVFLNVTDRKLLRTEFPHNLYIQNYSSAKPNESCIALRKWVFAPTQELLMNHDEKTMSFLFWQVRGPKLIQNHGLSN